MKINNDKKGSKEKKGNIVKERERKIGNFIST